MSEQKIKLTVSQILSDLHNGLDRKAIREKYKLSATDAQRLFQHEKLKNVRVRTAPAFELEDDTEEVPTKAAPTRKEKSTKAPATATAETSEAQEVAEVVAEETAITEEEKPEPTGNISEVSSDDDEVDVKQGLW